ncbi:hypothetical protein L4D76_19710 [Photobacterium sagamiensis]|uniref:YtfJ family protein n=1 Tax=Photobacterium sagamiensis TaxID=2910241 RepID=UPI003D0AD5EC
MKTKIISLAVALAFLPSIASAHNVEVGKALPSATVSEGGIASLSGGEVNFAEWSADQIPSTGTVVIIASAARPAASEMTPADLIESLEINKSVKLFKIINSDDAPFGAGMFIEGAVKDGKIENPSVEAVIDEDGELFYEWDLKPENSLIAVVKNGKVAYAHEGVVGDAEKSEVLKLTK